MAQRAKHKEGPCSRAEAALVGSPSCCQNSRHQRLWHAGAARALLPSAPGKTQRALNNPNSLWPAGFQSPWPCCLPHLQGQCTAPGARAAA